MTSRTVFAAIAAMVCICGNGRDMPIQNGRLVNALNANQNMITNLPPEFWEGHTGGGADTNAVRSLIDASFVGGTNAVNTALGSYVTEQAAGAVATNTVDAKVAPWAMKGQPQPGGGGADTNAVNDLIREYDTTNLTARINYRTTTNDVNAIIASSNLASVSSVELKRDKTDRVWTTAGFTPWTATGVPQGWTLIGQPYQDELRITWRWDCTDDNGERTHFFSMEYSPTATSVTMWNDNGAQYEIVASRQLVPADNLALTSEISSSAFTNAGAVVAATNSAKAYADATFLKGDGEFQEKSLHLNAITAEGGISTTGHITLQGGWDYLEVIAQTFPQYLDSLSWRTTGNRTLANYGIANAYTKSEINGNAVTNGGAKAYADYVGATTLASATNSAKSYADAKFLKGTKEGFYTTNFTTREIPIFINGISFNGLMKIYKKDDKYEPYFIDDIFVFEGADTGQGTKHSDLKVDGSDIITQNVGDNRYLRSYTETDPTATAKAQAAIASTLTGRTYDFANGSNFTKNLYTALTNVIQTLGGTVANPPNFN